MCALTLCAGSDGTVRTVKDYYEELWDGLPEHLDPPDLELRLAFLRSRLGAARAALDLGCGAGEFTAAIAARGVAAIGSDVAQAALERRARATRSSSSGCAEIDRPLPFDDNEFDLVWASEVIEHVGDTARWLSEVRRVLVPAGRLLITTPSHGRLRLLLGGIERFSEPLGDHLHLYTPRLARPDARRVRVRRRCGCAPPVAHHCCVGFCSPRAER